MGEGRRLQSTGGRPAELDTTVRSSTRRLDEVVKRFEGNAFAKHLAVFHPEHEGDITKFTIKVVSSFLKRKGEEST